MSNGVARCNVISLSLTDCRRYFRSSAVCHTGDLVTCGRICHGEGAASAINPLTTHQRSCYQLVTHAAAVTLVPSGEVEPRLSHAVLKSKEII
ncbi:hypothetical protein E2C01_087322 [Portunus trituberculatus]|uniref:Uncharacterized protein n=1 Tax=Portunus trituberculatus TaxID=210409 RepID=A0A5B7JIX0_PORTR|nr:hypothetical protein [Portunus trituberculatus]